MKMTGLISLAAEPATSVHRRRPSRHPSRAVDILLAHTTDRWVTGRSRCTPVETTAVPVTGTACSPTSGSSVAEPSNGPVAEPSNGPVAGPSNVRHASGTPHEDGPLDPEDVSGSSVTGPSNHWQATGSPDLLTQIKAFNWQDHRNGNIPNARMISPWLLRTRWHEQVQPYRENHADLIWLVSMPGSDDTDMKNLHKTVRKYYDQATNLIDGTDELVLQIINSSDPKKEGYNNTPLHRHHQGAKTLAADIVPVTHLLAGLLRHSDHYTFPSSPQLTTALGDLKDDDRSEDALHAVLMALWKTTWSATEQNQFPDPTMCFLMMFSLKKGGEFANPKDTTHLGQWRGMAKHRLVVNYRRRKRTDARVAHMIL
ncbi:hypothetical protein B0H10DRAFT_2443284 [Mycena sp. CBHHK59/15]|nr:hypothetical protein B0H10DRAFT_2444604 [Mycena sp. CBHHK59/15]KAJ6580260.1 hypothetical protein B0H10DRAFT_2443284 [Mycena sp. CBHHK59/15]